MCKLGVVANIYMYIFFNLVASQFGYSSLYFRDHIFQIIIYSVLKDHSN